MIVGYLLTKVNAERDTSVQLNGPTTITQKPEIKDVEKNEKLLIFTFDFLAEYAADNKKYASIEVVSKIFYTGDNIDKVYDNWTKNRQLDKDVGAEIVEFGSNLSLMEVISLSRSMQLPLLQIVRVEKS